MIRPARLPDDRPALAALFAAAGAAGRPPMGEEAQHDLAGPAPSPGLVAEEGGAAAGYVHLREWRGGVVAETAVLPGREDVLPPLVGAAVARCGDRRVRLWARDDACAAAAAAAGLTATRTLLRMECPLPSPGEPAPPAGVRIARFRPGADEDAYLLVSNESFSGHPDSSGWDRQVLADRMGRPWFDPAGVFLAWEAGRPVGFCWVKLHGGALGEIYSIAVRPDAAGRGLGRALALGGLRHAAASGAARGLLYADAHNRQAVDMYRRLGFEEVGRDREFTRAREQPGQPKRRPHDGQQASASPVGALHQGQGRSRSTSSPKATSLARGTSTPEG